MDMRREIKFYSGYDCMKFECKFDSERCVPSGGGSHGVHGLDIGFFVHGKKGVIQFKLSTGWLPQKVKESRIGNRELSFNNLDGIFPMATDLGYHAYEPQYEGQTTIQDKCEMLGGKPCYYDGSSLNANDAFYTLLNAGEESLWEFLEKYYKCTFEGGKYPQVYEYPKKEREKDKVS